MRGPMASFAVPNPMHYYRTIHHVGIHCHINWLASYFNWVRQCHFAKVSFGERMALSVVSIEVAAVEIIQMWMAPWNQLYSINAQNGTYFVLWHNYLCGIAEYSTYLTCSKPGYTLTRSLQVMASFPTLKYTYPLAQFIPKRATRTKYRNRE